MKKIISVLLIMVICTTSSCVFAMDDLGCTKVNEKVAIKVYGVDTVEAVLVISQFRDDKLVDMEITNIENPEKGYLYDYLVVEKDVEYKAYVYDNLTSLNLLFNPLEFNYETENQVAAPDPYYGVKFHKIK